MGAFFTTNTIAELICFFIAVLCLSKDKSSQWKLMLFFLLITCVAEMAGIYVKKLYLADRAHVRPNAWVYNILLVIQAGFISLMFHSFLDGYNKGRLVIIGGIAFLVPSYLFEVYQYGVFPYHIFTNSLMSILFVLYSLYYFYFLFKDEAYTNLIYSPEFWWVAGILFFYFGTTVCNLLYDKLSFGVVIGKKHFSYYKYLYYAFNIILYGCWSYSFICRKWMTLKA